MNRKDLQRHATLAAFALALALCATGCATGGVPAITAHARDLQAGKAAVQARLDALHRDLDAAELAIGRPQDLAGPFAQSLLDGILRDHPRVLFCATADTRDRAMAVAPADGPLRPGDTLAARGRFNPKTVEGDPLMSFGFPLPDRPNALFGEILFPVADAAGTVFGNLRVRLDLTGLLADELEPIVAHGRATFWVLQSDGVTLYDPDDIEIGRNVFTDILYRPFEDLTEVSRRIVNAPTGHGQYKFFGTGMGTATRKFCNWDTVALYGSAWRIVLVREAG